MNFGTLFIFLWWILIKFMLYFLATKCKIQRFPRVRAYLFDDLIWTSVLEFFIQAYLEICFAAILNIREEKWDTAGLFFSNFCLYFFSFFVVALPIWLLVFLYWKFDKLAEPEY